MFAKSGVVSLGGQLVVEFISETLCRGRGNGGNFSCVLGKDMVVADANRSIMLPTLLTKELSMFRNSRESLIMEK